MFARCSASIEPFEYHLADFQRLPEGSEFGPSCSTARDSDLRLETQTLAQDLALQMAFHWFHSHTGLFEATGCSSTSLSIRKCCLQEMLT